MSEMILEAMKMYTNIFEIIDSSPAKISEYKVRIDCNMCKAISEITIGAVCKQHERGRMKYLCPKCSGSAGWTDTKRKVASKRSKANWANPNYAGRITGKAIAREIVKGKPKRKGKK